MPVVLDPVVRAAPAADGREVVATWRNGAAVEQDGVRDRQPAKPAGGHAAAIAPHVPPDRDEVVVTREHVREAELLPNLTEPRIDVEKDAPPGGGQHLGIAHEAHDVEQEARAGGAGERLLPAQPAEGLSVRAEDAVGNAVAAEQTLQLAERRVFVHRHARLEPVDDRHLEAEIAEAEHVLEQRPGVAAVAGAVRERRADDDRVGHRRAAYGRAARHGSRPRSPWEPIGLPLEVHADGHEPPRRDAGEGILAALARPHEHCDQLLLLAHREAGEPGTSAPPSRPRRSSTRRSSGRPCSSACPTLRPPRSEPRGRCRSVGVRRSDPEPDRVTVLGPNRACTASRSQRRSRCNHRRPCYIEATRRRSWSGCLSRSRGRLSAPSRRGRHRRFWAPGYSTASPLPPRYRSRRRPR